MSLQRCFLHSQGASGKWCHLPYLQSSQLIFPITAQVAARPAPCLTADNRPSFISLLLFSSGCWYPLALCAQNANNKNESFKCATFGFAAQASAAYMSWVSLHLFHFSNGNFYQDSWSWGSSFRWDLIQVLFIYLFSGGRVFHLFWHYSMSALLTFSWLSEAVCQHLADDQKSFVALLNVVMNVSAISGLFFLVQCLICCVRNIWNLKWMASDDSSKRLHCCMPPSF